MELGEEKRGGRELLDSLIREHVGDAMRSAAVEPWAWQVGADQVLWSMEKVPGQVGPPDIAVGSLANFLATALAEDRAELATAFENCRSGTAEIHHTFRFHHRDGALGRTTLDAVPIVDAQGIAAFVGVTRDDTEQMLLFERLEESFAVRDRVARALEISLLPPTLPEVPGCTVDASFRSIEGTATGDFYDLFPLGGRDWGLTIGDVGGHGTDAAAITTAIRYTLRAAAQLRQSPASVIEAANQAHFAAVRDERFTTAHYIHLRPGADSFELNIATAGHPALFVRRSSAKVEAVAGTGPMLGLMETAEFAVTQMTLHAGDMIVACTDGVLEARRDGAMFGHSAIDSFLRAWDKPVAGCAAALHDVAAAFAGGSAGDDMATVVLRVNDA